MTSEDDPTPAADEPLAADGASAADPDPDESGRSPIADPEPGVTSPWRAGSWSGGSIVGRVRRPLLRILSLSWVPLTASFLSLALSVTAIIVSTHQPEVMLILPDQVRVAQGRSSGSAYVYLQPAFVSTGQNERVEVIRDMTLVVQPQGGASASFRWDEQARFVGDPETGTLGYEYVADAVPLLVSPRSASAPLCLFDAPESWFFAPGTYTFTLVAHRVVVSDPVRASFEVVLSDDDIAFLDGPGFEQFLSFPIR